MSIPKIKLNDKSLMDIVMNLSTSIDSLSEYTQVANLRPVVLVEKSIMNSLDESVLNDIMQTQLSLYAGFYLQAASLSLNVGEVKIRELLSPLATHPDQNAVISLSFEGYDNTDSLTLANLGMESSDNARATAKINSEVAKPVNLAVGKMIDVPLTIVTGKKDGNDVSSTTTMPVSIILNPRVADMDFIARLLAYTNKDKTWVGRYHSWRAGEIKSFLDYAFMLDILKEERDLAITDKDGTYANFKSRQSKGVVAKVVTGKDHINIASNMTVISKVGATRLEQSMRGRFRNYKKREEYFRESGSMLLTIVDAENERLTLYTRGFAESGIYTFRDIKSMGSNPSAGTDISAILKAFKMGNIPNF